MKKTGVSIIVLLFATALSMTSLSSATKKDILSIFFSQSPRTSVMSDRTSITSPAPSSLAIVKRVVDGDTLVVDTNGKEEKVRLIGINTPETVDPRKPVECFGKEASQYMKTLVDKKQVQLEADPTQDNRDKYKRLLRYVYLSDGTFVNKKMIEGGYAYEYTYEVPYQFQSVFKDAQTHAEQQEAGLWGKTTCSGEKRLFLRDF